jgi:hypothetical protein
MGNCKACGKQIPDGLDSCRICAEKHLNPKPEIETQTLANQKEGEKIVFAEELLDGAFQRGIHWRKNKLEVIFKTRKAGVSDEQILRQLRIGGITIQKARELMRDSEELLGR